MPVINLPTINTAGELATTQQEETTAPPKANKWLTHNAFFLQYDNYIQPENKICTT